MPAFQLPVATSHSGYTGPQGQAVGLHLTYYRQQDYERKLVSSLNMLVDQPGRPLGPSGGRQRHHRAGRPAARRGRCHAAQPVRCSTANSQRLQVWRFYWVNNRFTASDALAKIQVRLSRITGQGDDGAIVVIYTPLAANLLEGEARAAADAALQDFLRSHGAGLEASLKQTREAH